MKTREMLAFASILGVLVSGVGYVLFQLINQLYK